MFTSKLYRFFAAVCAIALAMMACGFDLGGSPQVAPQPQVIVITAQPPANQVEQANQGGGSQSQNQAPPVDPPAAPVVPTATVVPPTVSNPATITAVGPVDCLPYPDFRFSYVDGIENGVSLQPIFKAEDRLSEPGVGWFEVKFEDGGAKFDCWVYGGFVTKSGDFSQLKEHKVIIPDPSKSHCDTAARLAKVRVGTVVWLPWSQAVYEGYTGWFNGMADYSGHRAKVTAFAGIDIAGCMTVYVDYDGGDYPWRIRDLLFGKP